MSKRNEKVITEIVDEQDIVQAIKTVILITADDKSIFHNRRSIIAKIVYEALRNKKITKPATVEKIFDFMRLNDANLFDAGNGYMYYFRTITLELSKMMDEDFFDKYYDMFYIDELFMIQSFSEKFIENHLDDLGQVGRETVSRYQDLSMEFIEKHSKKLDFPYLLKYRNLSANFINKNSKKISTMLKQKKYKDLAVGIKKNTKLGDEARTAIEAILLFNKLRDA